jgi:hypothetical protein
MRVLRRAVVAVGLAVLALAAGCWSRSPVGTSSKNRAGGSDTTVQQSEIEDQLKSALYQLQPDKLGIESNLDDAVSVLNNWWSAVETADLEPTGLTPPPIPKDRVPEALGPRLEQKVYDLQDGRHIRAAYLANTIAFNLADQAEQELDRTVRAFEWVCRNVTLVPEDEPQPPLATYEILLVGRGRAADRAWVFGEILKQLRIDSVVMQSQAEGASLGPMLVGVPLDGEVYLFDPQLGLPIPRADDATAARIVRPATLREIREHPEWLKALAPRSDQPYEPTAEQIASARVHAITSPTAWTSRMWNLEQLLPSVSLCVLYEAPAALGDAEGLFDRIAAAEPSWSADAIGVWVYPIQKEAQFVALNPSSDPNAVQLAQAAMLPFAVPLEEKKDADDRLAKEMEAHQDWLRDKKGDAARKAGQIGPSLRHLKTRTLQLQGRYSDAIAQFVTIRQLAVMPPPDPNWGQVYQHAAQDAFYWSCVSKHELGEYESAIGSLTEYIKRYRRGRWAGAAGLLIAECHRELGRLPEAIQALKTAPPEDAYRTTTAVLAKRWSEATAASVP